MSPQASIKFLQFYFDELSRLTLQTTDEECHNEIKSLERKFQARHTALLLIEQCSDKKVQASVKTEPVLSSSKISSSARPLKSRFSDPAWLAKMYTTDLRELRPVKTCNSVNLRPTLNFINEVVNKLLSCGGGFNEKKVGNFILSKFPMEIVLPVVEKNLPEDIKTDIELCVLLAGLDRQITALEYINTRTSNLRMDSEPSNQNEASKTAPRKRQASGDTKNTNDDYDYHNCMFCGGHHQSQNCRWYPTSEARITRCIFIKRCPVCTDPGHKKEGCKHTARPCRICSKPGHNAPLCPTNNEPYSKNQTKQ